MSRTGPTPVLVAHRPGGGLLAQSVKDFDDAMDFARRLSDAFAPGLRAGVTWWIVPNSDPISAGSEAMAAEVQG